jgi:hypothetical protein
MVLNITIVYLIAFLGIIPTSQFILSLTIFWVAAFASASCEDVVMDFIC